MLQIFLYITTEQQDQQSSPHFQHYFDIQLPHGHSYVIPTLHPLSLENQVQPAVLLYVQVEIQLARSRPGNRHWWTEVPRPDDVL